MSHDTEAYVWLSQSAYSFLHGCSQPQELLLAAAEQKYDGICLADFDGVYGLARFYLFSQSEKFSKVCKRKMKLFYGAQIRVALGNFDGVRTPLQCDLESLLSPGFLQSRLVLIAESMQGYISLCQLLRYTHRNGKNAGPVPIDDPDVPWPKKDVAAILPMRGSSALCSFNDVLFDEEESADNTENSLSLSNLWLNELGKLYNFWKKNSSGLQPFYLAVTPPTQALEYSALKAHLYAHEQLEIPLIATEDVFFARPEEKQKHDLIQAIRLNAPMSEIADWAFLPNTKRSLPAPSRLYSFCKADPRFLQAYENNILLAQRMNFSFSELNYKYPQEFVPAGLNSFEFLSQLTWQMAKEKYPQQIPDRVQSLLKKELLLIQELCFADYFLTVWDIVTFARKQNILCQGRGSAANSCVCFVLGITAVDPMVSDILFERFISRERGEPPDIDVDFEHERREEVIQYIYHRYGRTRAAMVANVICFRRQGALRAAGKALGIPLRDVDVLLKGTRDRFEKGMTLEEILERKISETGLAISSSLKEHWLECAKLIEGIPRHLGIHSGGFVISQNSLDSLCPTEPATMEDRTVIQWCKDDLEGLGLFKIDVLALGMLTALRKTLCYLKQDRITHESSLETEISLESIPPDCRKTYDMICASKTMGTFQIESRAQMSIIPRLQPRNFYDLVIQIGIIRPGPIVAGIVTRYVKRRTGEEAVFFPDERLRPILERTLGVPVFQEQVMRIAMTVGDFSPGEADELRRSMGVWKLNGTIEKFEEKLRAGMKRNGISEEFASEIYKQIEGFSEYGFPESHAISFAHLAYASAWLKAHHPAYFLLGLLNSQPLGFYSAHSLIQEARREGVHVLQSCLVFSEWDHALTHKAGEKAGIRLGLRIVKGLTQKSAESFCEQRKKWLKEFAPHHPLRARGAMNNAKEMKSEALVAVWSSHKLQDALEAFLRLMSGIFDAKESLSLLLGGLLDAFSLDRRMLLWHFLGRPGHLSPDLDLHAFSQLQGDSSCEWLESYEDLQADFQFLGTSLRKHPLFFIKKWLWPFECAVESLTTSERLSQLSPNQKVSVCGIVIVKQAPPTAKGMVFVTLEDETGNINITFTPQTVERYRQVLTSPQAGILCLQGILQGAAFGHSVRVTHVFKQGKIQSRENKSSSTFTRASNQDNVLEGFVTNKEKSTATKPGNEKSTQRGL